MKTNTFTQLILVLVCLTTAVASYAQNVNIKTDNIQWNASGFTDLMHNTPVPNTPCFFKSSATQIDWVQGNGSYVNSFSIVGTSGTWSDLTKSGSITMKVANAPLAGEIVFSKDNKGISIKVTLSGGTDPISNLYTISSIEKL